MSSTSLVEAAEAALASTTLTPPVSAASSLPLSSPSLKELHSLLRKTEECAGRSRKEEPSRALRSPALSQAQPAREVCAVSQHRRGVHPGTRASRRVGLSLSPSPLS
jgi:hypothetical protein